MKTCKCKFHVQWANNANAPAPQATDASMATFILEEPNRKQDMATKVTQLIQAMTKPSTQKSVRVHLLWSILNS